MSELMRRKGNFSTNCILGYLTGLLLFSFTACKDVADTFTLHCNVSHCDPEHQGKEHDHFVSKSNKIKVRLGGVLSTDEYYSGSSSIQVTKEHKYAFTSKINDVKMHQFFRVTAWRKDKSGTACLVAASEKGILLHKSSTLVIEKGKNGWEKVELTFEVSPIIKSLTVFAYLAKADSAYFDDFTVEKMQAKQYPVFENRERINLYLSDHSIQEIEKERAEAYFEGVHFSNDNWLKGVFSGDNEVIPVKARLKGDWLDHLKGTKWSFRLKTRKGKTFRRMKAFSVQNPESRFFLHEYLSHQLFLQEGLLTTRYDFSPVALNGKSVGFFAIEEHFAKQLIEYNLRREGPIVKFDENPKWKASALSQGLNDMDLPHIIPEFHVSRVLPFERSSIVKNPKLFSQFQIAQSLILQYKYRQAPAEEIFEVDKLAKLLALTDIANGKHGATWHNQRFYYNPISCKIEIINYDNFATYHFGNNASPFALSFDQKTYQYAEDNLFPFFFQSEVLLEKYIYYLEQYSSQEFITDFYASQKAKIAEYLPLIQQEFPSYHIDSTFLLSNAEDIRKRIPELREKQANGFFQNIVLEDKMVNTSELYLESIIPYYVNSFYSPDGKKATLQVRNFNGQRIRILGINDKKGRRLYSFDSPIVLPSYNESKKDTTVSLPYFEKAQQLIFEDLAENQEHVSELTPWKKNTDPSPYQELLASESSAPEQLFEVNGDTLLLKAGKYQLTERVLIPEGRTVLFEAGVELDLIQEACLISHSPFIMEGTAENPIKIFSSDLSSNGIAVLQANAKSGVKHVVFSGLNTLDYKGWTLSGAVNFYESEVEIYHATFERNLCEDALNIIRSNFLVSNCKFLDIYADAFDSDFCNGTLTHSLFNRVGNDAIDFSTSQISIENCSIQNIQDKGVSGGEGSTLWVKNTSIENCNIGTASKDLSEVSLENCSISNCQYGLVVLQKKPEYGPAQIESKELSLSNCTEELLIEKASFVLYNGKKIIGQKEKVAEMFY